MLKKISLFLIIMLFSNCQLLKKEDSPCKILSRDIHQFIKEIKLDSVLKNDYQGLTIAPGIRTGRHIRVHISNETGRERVRFTDFHPTKPHKLRCAFSSFSENLGIIEKYTGQRFSSRPFLNYWHAKINWLYENDLLALSDEEDYFSVLTNVVDSSYYDLKACDEQYIDKSYEFQEEKIMRKNCPIRYRYSVILLKKPTSVQESKITSALRKRKSIYKLDSKTFYCRKLSHSAFCSLDFGARYCNCNK